MKTHLASLLRKWQMIKKLSSIILIMLTSCGAANSPVPQDLLVIPYIQQFFNYYGQDTSQIEIDLVDKFTNTITNGQVGLCTTGISVKYNTIQLSRSYWNQASDISKKILLFHELGHCLFNRIHKIDLYPDNCPRSIMFPDVLQESCFLLHQTDLLKELPLTP